MKELFEDGFLSFCIVIILITSISGAVTHYWNKQTTQEAIKAGLVQDKEGHWVKPSLEK